MQLNLGRVTRGQRGDDSGIGLGIITPAKLLVFPETNAATVMILYWLGLTREIDYPFFSADQIERTTTVF